MNNNTEAVIQHYDKLIDENNDPTNDPPVLRKHMDKWDGQAFIDKMNLDKSKSVLEIGVGTGRLALRVAPLCSTFCGIDISPKTVDRAKLNLSQYKNVKLMCADFLTYQFNETFDIIYSSLTFMHIKNKKTALCKIADLLNNNGIFALSIDKNQDQYIECERRKIFIYPDIPEETIKNIVSSGLIILNKYESEHAHIFICTK